MHMTLVFAASAFAAGMASLVLPHQVGRLGFAMMTVYLGLGLIAAVSGLLAGRRQA